MDIITLQEKLGLKALNISDPRAKYEADTAEIFSVGLWAELPMKMPG